MRTARSGSRWLWRRTLLAPLLVLVALWIPGVHQGGFRVDTGVYAAIGLHAWRDGSLFPLWAGDQPYFNKPPLSFWIHGALLDLLGPRLWVARLGSLLAAAACTVATMGAARALFGRWASLWAGLVLVLTLEFFRYTHAISLDLWQASWVMTGLWFAAAATSSRAAAPTSTDSRSSARLLLLAGVPWGLALLTKPFVALLAPALLGLWMLPAARRRHLPWLLGATGLAALIALPWHLAMARAFGDSFTSVYFGKQTLDRAAGGRFADEPWWFYGALLARTYWPWLLTLALGAALALRRRVPAHARSGAAFALLWCVGWLLALTLFGGKSGRYALILYPVAAWLSAIWLLRLDNAPLIRCRRAAERWLAPAIVLGAIGLVVGGVRIHAPEDPQWPALHSELRERQLTELWAPPDLLWSTSNVYLASGLWARTARTEGRQDLFQPGDPPVGSLMLFRTDGRYLPRATDEVVWRSGKLLLVRTAAAWDGAIQRNPADPRSDDAD